jgi:hypothetical protein
VSTSSTVPAGANDGLSWTSGSGQSRPPSIFRSTPFARDPPRVLGDETLRGDEKSMDRAEARLRRWALIERRLGPACSAIDEAVSSLAHGPAMPSDQPGRSPRRAVASGGCLTSTAPRLVPRAAAVLARGRGTGRHLRWGVTAVTSNWQCCCARGGPTMPTGCHSCHRWRAAATSAARAVSNNGCLGSTRSLAARGVGAIRGTTD